MKTLIATVSTSGDIREKLAVIAATGFDGVEILEISHFRWFAGRNGHMARDHGPEITLFRQ